MTYTVRRLSEKEFFGLQESWDHLLEQSNADPLFMSWAWQASWWETWGGDRLNLDLLLLGVYAPGRYAGWPGSALPECRQHPPAGLESSKAACGR